MTVDTIVYKGYTVKIKQDDCGDDPRGWDNFGTMYCFHRNYKLGDAHSYSDPTELAETVNDKTHIILPLYLYDHSGITMNTTGFSCGWDSGQVGVIAISKEKARKVFGWKLLTKKRIGQIYESLVAEVEIYDQYIRGDIYGYMIENMENMNTMEDSCWGYYGYDHEASGLLPDVRSAIDRVIDRNRVRHLAYLKSAIKHGIGINYRRSYGEFNR